MDTMVLWFSQKRDSRSFLSIHLKKLRSSYLEFYQPIFFCFLFFGKNRLGSSHVPLLLSLFFGWSIDLVFFHFYYYLLSRGRNCLFDGWFSCGSFFVSSENQWIFQGHSFLRVSSNFSECLSFLQLNAHRLFVTVYSQSSSYTTLFNIFYSSKISSKFNL